MLLFIICWSGTFAVVANEIDWLVTPDLRLKRPVGEPNWPAMLEGVQSALPDAAGVSVAAPLYPAAAAVALVRQDEKGTRLVFIHPQTGSVLNERDYYTVQRFFRSFHSGLHFFMPNWGIYLVSAFSITLGLSVVAALLFYRRWWTRFLTFRAADAKALWSHVHRLGGLWSLWFILVVVVTSLWYGVERIRFDFGDGIIAFSGAEGSAVHAVQQPDSTSGLQNFSVEELLARARGVRPDLSIRTVRIDRRGRFYIDGQSDHLLVRDRANQLHLDRSSGDVLYNQTPHDYSLYWRWSDTADPLHFGDFGGLTSKLIWFAFGLILCGLILTGTWLHAHRLARETGAAHRHRWPGTGAAIVVTLVVLAASVPSGFHEAREFYGPTVDGVKQLPSLAPGVRAFIIGWVTLTLGIIGAWILLLWRPQLVLDPVNSASRHGARREDRPVREEVPSE